MGIHWVNSNGYMVEGKGEKLAGARDKVKVRQRRDADEDANNLPVGTAIRLVTSISCVYSINSIRPRPFVTQ